MDFLVSNFEAIVFCLGHVSFFAQPTSFVFAALPLGSILGLADRLGKLVGEPVQLLHFLQFPAAERFGK